MINKGNKVVKIVFHRSTIHSHTQSMIGNYGNKSCHCDLFCSISTSLNNMIYLMQFI